MEDFLAGLGWVAAALFGLTLLVLLVLGFYLVRKHKAVHRPDTPVAAKVSYWGSIVYAVFPVDLLPDPILLDDITVVATALAYVGHATRKAVRRRGEERLGDR